MKRIPLCSGLLIFWCLLASCKGKSGPSNVAEQRWVVVTCEGEFEDSINVTGWKPGEVPITLSIKGSSGLWHFIYPWQGEDTIDFDIEDGLLYVNENLVGADLRVCAQVNAPESIITLSAYPECLSELEQYPNVTVLTFRGVTDDDLSFVDAVPGLRMLFLELDWSSIPALYRAKVTDTGFSHIAGLSKLVNLSVYCPSAITDEGIERICNLENLRTLCISDTLVTDKGAEYLAKLKNLHVLDLSEAQITDSGLAYLAQIPHLYHLDLAESHVTDLGVREYISAMTELRFLDLCHTGLTDMGLSELYGLTELRTLDIGFTDITGEGFYYLKDLTKLTELDVNMTHFNSKGASYLLNYPKLRELSLTDTYILDSDLKYIRRLTELRILSLGSTSITDRGLANLTKLNNLEWLFLDITRVGDGSIKHLKKLKSLKHLHIVVTNVTEGGVADLQEALPECEIHHSERKPL